MQLNNVFNRRSTGKNNCRTPAKIVDVDHQSQHRPPPQLTLPGSLATVPQITHKPNQVTLSMPVNASKALREKLSPSGVSSAIRDYERRFRSQGRAGSETKENEHEHVNNL